jgi:agmatinase
VYVSVDLDVFDASLMPAVGTPEPGGMSWHQVNSLLLEIVKTRRIVGFDVCELSPMEGPAACSYTAAKLVYKLVAYATAPPRGTRTTGDPGRI